MYAILLIRVMSVRGNVSALVGGGTQMLLVKLKIMLEF